MSWQKQSLGQGNGIYLSSDSEPGQGNGKNSVSAEPGQDDGTVFSEPGQDNQNGTVSLSLSAEAGQVN